MFGASDTTGVVVAAWAVGVVGVLYGLGVAITGRARLIRGGRVREGPSIRLMGLLCAAFSAAVAWWILSHPVLQ